MIATRRLHPDAVLPKRAHAGDAGLDLYSSEDSRIPAGGGVLVATGIAMAVPLGYVGMIADRSSMARNGIKTAGGIIDSGYRGEIKVILRNLTQDELQIKKGEKIAQFLVLPVALLDTTEVEILDDTSRGAGGFGSTGR